MEKLVEICSAVYFIAIFTELIRRKRWLRFLLEATVYLAVLVVALLINNARTGVVAFGALDTSPVGAVGIMFVATILGIAAKFLFYLERDQFSWFELLKPIAISPMVLLPLIGSVQANGNLSGMQIISFSVLAFQNGFFWQAVLTAAKPTLAKESGS
jgi:hypothetical protein